MRSQRLVYLRTLGAEHPRPPAPPPERARRTPKPAPAGTSREEPRRYRFVYEKVGAAAYLSHLDLIRALPRAFRRLGLPISYTGGFHPKPDMTFGPALSLGVASLCEVVDMKLAADLAPDDLVDDLSAGAQPGLRFVRGARVGTGQPGITRLVDAARYVVGIPRGAIATRGGDEWVRTCIERALAARELWVVRRIEGIGKRVDVRDFLRAIEVADATSAKQFESAGILGSFAFVAAEVEIRGSGGVKIAEVVEAVFGDAELPHRAVRVALGARQADGRIASPLEQATPAGARVPVTEAHAP
jgi:radical SAM-linked protein